MAPVPPGLQLEFMSPRDAQGKRRTPSYEQHVVCPCLKLR